MSVKQSASLTATQLLGAVGSLASTVTTAAGVLGNAAEVASLHSEDWLKKTKLEVKANAISREYYAVDNVAYNLAQSKIARNRELAKDEELHTVYKELFKLAGEELSK